MNKFVQINDAITLNDTLKFNTQEFQILEPGLQPLPTEFHTRYYSPEEKIHQIHGKTTLNAPLPWSDGDRYIFRYDEFVTLRKHLDKENISEFDQIIQDEQRKRMSYDIARKMEYPAIDELVIAMWEYLISGDKTSMDYYETLRQQIKHKYPKR